jgi:hypothetical protein
MDELSVRSAIAQGKRLYHGLPFVVLALDVRDPLGFELARVFHGLGDVRHPRDIQRRAERRERAPVVVFPSSLARVRKLVQTLLEMDADQRAERFTHGDVSAMRFFVRGALGMRDGVAVFLAADEERRVIRFPLHRARQGHAATGHVDPPRLELLGAQDGAAANSNDDAGDEDLDLGGIELGGIETDDEA